MAQVVWWVGNVGGSMALAPGDSGTWRLVIGEAGTCGFATLVVGGLVAQIPWW